MGEILQFRLRLNTMRLAFILVLFSFSVSGQTLTDLENELHSLKASMERAGNDSLRRLTNDTLLLTFTKALQLEGSFNHDFSSVKPIGNIRSSDNKVRIITWNLPLDDGTHEYYGFVQVKGPKYGTKLHVLKEDSVPMESPEMSVKKASNWYGALYFDIARVKRRRKVFYTLLGWDGNDLLSTKKIIDALTVDNKGNITFGLSRFKVGRKTKRRVIFEYSSEYVMSLRFDDRKKVIVFDHLDVDNNRLKGIPEYYGPDGTYDALILKKGRWYYEPYYDARNQRDRKDRKYRDPHKKNEPPKPEPTRQ